MFSQFRLVFLLHATAFEQLIVKLLNLQHCQLFQLYISKFRNDVVIDGVVVKFLGRVSHLRLDVNGVPQLQPLFKCITPSFHRIQLPAVLDGGTQLVLDLRLRSATPIFSPKMKMGSRMMLMIAPSPWVYMLRIDRPGNRSCSDHQT